MTGAKIKQGCRIRIFGPNITDFLFKRMLGLLLDAVPALLVTFDLRLVFLPHAVIAGEIRSYHHHR
ncbi:hypothetical protein [Bifidobacterium sp. ESL0825]|uniref:hypothetical protein n=1 Tax=Bifidobacterium sp. ESL0825 TaxID=3448587 RepID=UPI004042B777